MADRKSRKGKGRRARGTGTIFFHPAKRRWVGRTAVGRTAAGRTLYVERSGATQAEVVRKLALAGPPGPDVTVAAWAGRWLAALQCRPATLAKYGDSVRLHIGPRLGHLKVRSVTPSQVEAFAAGCRATLGANSTRNVLTHLGMVLRAAVRDGIAERNPVAVARKPKAVRKGVDPFTPAELSLIVARAGDAENTCPFALLAGTGCRVGEALALDVADLDPAAGTVSITKTFDREHGTGPPKSAAGVRTVRVPAPALPALARACGGRAAGPLFVTARGNRRIGQLVSQAWAGLLRRLGLAYRNPHQLRHSVATHLVSAGVPIGDVAAYLGDTEATVVKTYLHPAGTDPADTLDALLGGG